MNESDQAAVMPLDEARFYIRQEMTQPDSLPAGGGEVVVFTTPRRAGRSVNEDGAAVVPLGLDHAVLLVVDGMGGAAAGDRAAAIAIRTVAERLARIEPEDRAIRNAALDGIEEANRAIRQLDVGAGTTVVAIAVSGPRIRSFHAGDSMALVIDDRGHPRWKTMPHSPVGYAIESGLMSEPQAMTHHARHLLANAVGKSSMHIEVSGTVTLQPGDTLLMASDGLFDNLLLREIGERVGGVELDDAVRELVETATRRMATPRATDPSKPDDLTVVAYRPNDPEALGTLEFAPVG